MDGTPERVRDRIVSIASDYGTTDVGIVTNCYNFEHRVRSYRLIAEVFEPLANKEGKGPKEQRTGK